MPNKPPTRCGRCHKTYRGSKCPHHAWENPGQGWRGRSTADPRWRGVRAWRLELNPLCQWPGCSDLADEVDHLDGTDYDDDSGEGASWLNLDQTRSLCRGHHRERTSQQGNEAQRRYGR